MITFAVSDVAAVRELLPPTSLAGSLGRRLERPPEAGACNVPSLVVPRVVELRDQLMGTDRLHSLVAAVHTAFERHHPLILRPDDVWLCLAQGLATHVRLHAEALRDRFVQHEGKTILRVRRDDFVKGASDNDWQGVFGELSDKIAEHVGKKRDLVVADFSTTGPIERAASQVVLFDALQAYFDLRVQTLCGIPEITLVGTVEDWESIRTRVRFFGELGMERWVNALLPILDQLVATARGQVDRAFWQSLYKCMDESGGPYVTGWINTLFPYIEAQDEQSNERGLRRNPSTLAWAENMWKSSPEAPGPADFPTGICAAPFLWEYLGTDIPMSFHGGFMGMAQDPATGAVQAAIGWAVGER